VDEVDESALPYTLVLPVGSTSDSSFLPRFSL